jgi:hypothetical protein
MYAVSDSVDDYDGSDYEWNDRQTSFPMAALVTLHFSRSRSIPKTAFYLSHIYLHALDCTSYLANLYVPAATVSNAQKLSARPEQSTNPIIPLPIPININNTHHVRFNPSSTGSNPPSTSRRIRNRLFIPRTRIY